MLVCVLFDFNSPGLGPPPRSPACPGGRWVPVGVPVGVPVTAGWVANTQGEA
ncbi:hypothetical protein [Kamptonema formosum]|uniref:hypothetical protein n=1 Tax=Kamptonema formosum TaxID=331992 RepID=UPI0012DF3CA5|nr:hypothetical protein [Oscillatoria sp. PCC 10802]